MKPSPHQLWIKRFIKWTLQPWLVTGLGEDTFWIQNRLCMWLASAFCKFTLLWKPQKQQRACNWLWPHIPQWGLRDLTSWECPNESLKDRELWFVSLESSIKLFQKYSICFSDETILLRLNILPLNHRYYRRQNIYNINQFFLRSNPKFVVLIESLTLSIILLKTDSNITSLFCFKLKARSHMHSHCIIKSMEI